MSYHIVTCHECQRPSVCQLSCCDMSQEVKDCQCVNCHVVTCHRRSDTVSVSIVML